MKHLDQTYASQNIVDVLIQLAIKYNIPCHDGQNDIMRKWIIYHAGENLRTSLNNAIKYKYERDEWRRLYNGFFDNTTTLDVGPCAYVF